MLPLFCSVTRHMQYNTLHYDLMDICHLWCYLTQFLFYMYTMIKHGALQNLQLQPCIYTKMLIAK
jgi:hypothetical protein